MCRGELSPQLSRKVGSSQEILDRECIRCERTDSLIAPYRGIIEITDATEDGFNNYELERDNSYPFLTEKGESAECSSNDSTNSSQEKLNTFGKMDNGL